MQSRGIRLVYLCLLASSLLATAIPAVAWTAVPAKPSRPASAPAPRVAQKRFVAFMPKRWVASAGIGMGVNGMYGAESPPLLSVSGDYGVNENVSVGVLVGRASATERTAFFDEAVEWRFGYTLIAARASYHLGDVAKNDRLDPYIGAAIGYNRVSVEAKASFISSEPFGADSYALYGVHAGARYLLNERVAGFVELGFGISQLSAGLSMRL